MIARIISRSVNKETDIKWEIGYLFSVDYKPSLKVNIEKIH